MDWVDELFKAVEAEEEPEEPEVEVEEPPVPPKPTPRPRKAKKWPKYWDVVEWVKKNKAKVPQKTLREKPDKWTGIIQTILDIAEEIYLG